MNLSTFVSVFAAAYALFLGMVILMDRRRSILHLSFAAGMFLLAVETILGLLASVSVEPRGVAELLELKLIAASLIPASWMPFCLGYARASSKRDLPKQILMFSLFLLAPVLLMTKLHDQGIQSVMVNTETGQWMIALGFAGFMVHILLLVGIVIGLMHLEQTFRASVGIMRWRIKFMVLGLGVLFVARAYTSSQYLLFGSLNFSLQFLDCVALALGGIILTRSLLRTGHFDVTVYPSRAMIQGSLTVIGAGLYLLAVGIFGKTLFALESPSSAHYQTIFGSLAILLLVIFLLSNQMRLLLRQFVSRHFNRPEFDYRAVWQTFISQTANKVEQKDLCESVVRLISDIFHAMSVNLWLLQDSKTKLTFGASTSMTADKAQITLRKTPTVMEALKRLGENGHPVNLDCVKEKWAFPLRQLHPMQFQRSGNLVAAPLISGDQLLGMITMGDRVGGLPFSIQDMDLLNSITDHAAACLMNIQLSHSLLDAKQLEAFQAMSAFVVHDLKNTASTLSLMLKNLPVHFDDPSFRQDALRGIGRTLEHLNSLIRRLMLVRDNVTPKHESHDLNQIVEEACMCLERDDEIHITKKLNASQNVVLDRSMMMTVVTNLILNARDATGPQGHIIVETSIHDDEAILTVSDDGCGMVSEFIGNSLFHPFKSTKKNGIGIGMFHCKMLVEAHHGRIDVESQPDHGTTFRIYIPMICKPIPTPERA